MVIDGLLTMLAGKHILILRLKSRRYCSVYVRKVRPTTDFWPPVIGARGARLRTLPTRRIIVIAANNPVRSKHSALLESVMLDPRMRLVRQPASHREPFPTFLKRGL